MAEPGFIGVAPGRGVIMMPPVSVCHHVSTIGQRPLADDVVVPLPRLGVDGLAHRTEDAQGGAVRAFVTWSSPAPINARMAVGAV